MPAVAGRIPHKGTLVRAALERLRSGPAANREIAAILQTDSSEAARRMVRQRQLGRVVRIDGQQGPGAVALYALTRQAKEAFEIEEATGKRVTLLHAIDSSREAGREFGRLTPAAAA